MQYTHECDATRQEQQAARKRFRALMVTMFGEATVNAQRQAIRGMIADAVGENTERHVRHEAR